MGAVKIQTYNQQLMNIADYHDRDQLKGLLRNLRSLESLAVRGDTVAAAIWVDLKEAVETAPLTNFQYICIIDHLIWGIALDTIAFEQGKDKSTIRDSVNGGVKRIQKVLIGGNLYAQKA